MRSLHALFGVPLAVVLVAACAEPGSSNPTGVDPNPAGGSADGGGDGGSGPGPDGEPIPTEPPREEERAAPACLDATAARKGNDERLKRGPYEASVRVESGDECARTYRLATTQPLRENLPENPRKVAERAGQPVLRTGSVTFDAMYALALLEVKNASADAITDGAFSEGRALACPPGGCFRTGRLWKYVWTRDTAYAAHLGLGLLDPPRMVNSLSFKLSPARLGASFEIVQDTGSGGSYPISTDRVVWAIGAKAQLAMLSGGARDAFAKQALDAIRGTVERDRQVAFDADDGLYRGETSFLDWREQTYLDSSAQDTTYIGTTKALSTNVLHYEALRFGAELARARNDEGTAARYEGWASALRARIAARFWVPEVGLFASYTGPALDGAPIAKYDALGIALTILSGVATEEQGRTALVRYPHYAAGLPVVWPQERTVAAYHNRALWPFVSAYWVKAARALGSDTVVTADVKSLVDLSALSLSHMENAELLTGLPSLAAPTGMEPVVNSHEQLWSLAGYLGVVHDVLFGLEVQGDGLRFRPFLPKALRRSLFADTDRLVLHRLPFRGKRITVALVLPKDDGGNGAYAIKTVRWNGITTGQGFRPFDAVENDAYVVVELANGGPAGAPPVTTIDADDDERTFAPRAPRMTSATADGSRVRVAWSSGGEPVGDLEFRVYRDGERVASVTSATTWDDPSGAASAKAPCYAVEAVRKGAGVVSLRSRPLCYWSSGRVTSFAADVLTRSGGRLTVGAGNAYLEDWGDPGHDASVELTPSASGTYFVQLHAANGAGPINTGITCGVKRIVVEEVGSGRIVGEGYGVVPHGPSWTTFLDSGPVTAKLSAGIRYRIRVDGGGAATNMSAFSHFQAYTGGLGGSSGPFSRINLAEIRVLLKERAP